MSVTPDDTAEQVVVGVLTSDPDAAAASHAPEVDQLVVEEKQTLLIYAVLLGTKAEAAIAIEYLLGPVNNTYANFPSEVIFDVTVTKAQRL